MASDAYMSNPNYERLYKVKVIGSKVKGSLYQAGDATLFVYMCPIQYPLVLYYETAYDSDGLMSYPWGGSPLCKLHYRAFMAFARNLPVPYLIPAYEGYYFSRSQFC